MSYWCIFELSSSSSQLFAVNWLILSQNIGPDPCSNIPPLVCVIGLGCIIVLLLSSAAAVHNHLLLINWFVLQTKDWAYVGTILFLCVHLVHCWFNSSSRLFVFDLFICSSNKGLSTCSKNSLLVCIVGLLSFVIQTQTKDWTHVVIIIFLYLQLVYCWVQQ